VTTTRVRLACFGGGGNGWRTGSGALAEFVEVKSRRRYFTLGVPSWGYPHGRAMIALSAILPLVWFKWRGWI
jgi:hypothetical protein